MWKARVQSIPFYLCRIFPIRRKKIVFCCIEGTTGYTCNPKYIAEEFIRRNEGYELVWLVNDVAKGFPEEIKVVRNTLWNRAYQLSTAHFWIDNSRKQLEARKRRGQIYIQTWHAKLGFKPTCLDRGKSFSRIAYLVSKHDSDMIDYVLSNSKWYDDTLPTGMIYDGFVLRTGSPRCDILVNDRTVVRKKVREAYHLEEDAKILMYAPTFRGGSQGTDRAIAVNQGFPDFGRLLGALEKRFGGTWYLFLRLHPQLVARNMDKGAEGGTGERDSDVRKKRILDVSRVDDMYEILAGCDAFMTDYSSAAFDAAVMKIPVFLYADDYGAYEAERGRLLWDLRELPFPLALEDEELEGRILGFDERLYLDKLDALFRETETVEDGRAAGRVADVICGER
ncbi:CDP-glycerol glycerophosphotransferase family protein [uncultured Acetatifactor sp.]|uniref:CDP-glycerol glycerophosphotransferase family protein n=1 Tax=uncultured Acetatifactor sp. TaxID=1671927 RepID=UPI0026058339|nr:CDP-glycerol glycerophosphotransferase family protein [uncultured Acetatifactor sp.]